MKDVDIHIVFGSIFCDSQHDWQDRETDYATKKFVMVQWAVGANITVILETGKEETMTKTTVEL